MLFRIRRHSHAVIVTNDTLPPSLETSVISDLLLSHDVIQEPLYHHCTSLSSSGYSSYALLLTLAVTTLRIIYQQIDLSDRCAAARLSLSIIHLRLDH
ncbi:hypothetical protein LOK49_LG03G03193 [Camellia lanceoleosa]|uniref:Uncharacterized protein n=1 Tax=Camellia lanceoleosa TaxID=1840588 RepID=A0ACC0I8G6_9ERIC|nr:hypothetical protein LOK49_LG03G03193 [Camellia lanceoleosa]